MQLRAYLQSSNFFRNLYTKYSKKGFKVHRARKTTLGSNPIFSSEEESRLENWIFTCQKKSFPVRVQCTRLIEMFSDENRPINILRIALEDVGTGPI